MTKKYNLIVGLGADNIELKQDDYQFTQEEIDDLKSQLPTEAMRKIVDLAKVEVKEPLYYMQTKRKDTYGCRFFFVFTDGESLEDTDVWLQLSIEDLLDNDCVSNHSLLRPKSEWEPYLTPDRELVKYEPKEDE